MVSCGSAGSCSVALCLPRLSLPALLVSECPMPAPAPQSCTFNVGIRVGWPAEALAWPAEALASVVSEPPAAAVTQPRLRRCTCFSLKVLTSELELQLLP